MSTYTFCESATIKRKILRDGTPRVCCDIACGDSVKVYFMWCDKPFCPYKFAITIHCIAIFYTYKISVLECDFTFPIIAIIRFKWAFFDRLTLPVFCNFVELDTNVLAPISAILNVKSDFHIILFGFIFANIALFMHPLIRIQTFFHIFA